jgi:hypothetical protein
MFTWPSLELTEYERRFVRYYRTSKGGPGGKGYPGVLKRVYRVDLISYAAPNSGFAAPQFQDTVQISRRSRVFGLVMYGDMASWRLRIETSSGEGFTSVEPQSSVDPLASAMVPGTYYNADAQIGEPPDAPQNQKESGVLLLEPNWELAPNTTLVFRGTLADGVPAEASRFLSIGVHVWEFPGMDMSEHRPELI